MRHADFVHLQGDSCDFLVDVDFPRIIDSCGRESPERSQRDSRPEKRISRVFVLGIRTATLFSLILGLG